jgi:hypothetical protein
MALSLLLLAVPRKRLIKSLRNPATPPSVNEETEKFKKLKLRINNDEPNKKFRNKIKLRQTLL